MRTNQDLLTELTAEYLEEFPHAADSMRRSGKALIHGGSHTLRLFEPAPFRVTGARGATVRDSDEHQILDLWQGHYANILGHNPPLVTDELGTRLKEGYGLQTGLAEDEEIAFAELLLRQTGGERLRFTSSGALATMYAIMLARDHTGRRLILKAGGGWQGGHPLALKGVSYRDGWEHSESGGLFPDEVADIRITEYNNPEDLEDRFRAEGDRIACFIVEPWMGMGGLVPSDPEYLDLARRLTERYGTVLIFDEIISGFRFCAGGVQLLYGITPDLTTYAKVIGGGMPLAAVVGKEELLRRCEPGRENRVKFEGGTFSAHPAAVRSGRLVVDYLARHGDEIYPRLGELGQRMRTGVEEAFARQGVLARCTGYGNDVVPNSSVGMTHFPHRPDTVLDRPDRIWDPAVCDVERREKVLKLALVLERVHVMHGLGALSTEHTEDHLTWLFEACEAAAARFART